MTRRFDLPLGFALAAFVIGTACISSLEPQSHKLQKAVADTEAEIAATDALYWYRCLAGPGSPAIPVGKTARDLINDAKASGHVPAQPGFVAPQPACQHLYEARVSAEAHDNAAIAVASNGSDAPELRKKLKLDRDAMIAADKEVRTAK